MRLRPAESPKPRPKLLQVTTFAIVRPQRPQPWLRLARVAMLDRSADTAAGRGFGDWSVRSQFQRSFSQRLGWQRVIDRAPEKSFIPKRGSRQEIPC